MKIAKKAVCLCSGGMDSTTAATIAKRAGYELYLFHVNYGQKAEKKELEVISKLKETLGRYSIAELAASSGKHKPRIRRTNQWSSNK